MAKITPQTKQTAIQIAAVIASGLAERGVMPTDKAMRNTCLTALRLMAAMDQVVATVEDNQELLTGTLEDAHATLHGLVKAAVVEDAKADTETKKSDTPTPKTEK